ncbi:MAG TPA: transglycosylase domain-containing protein [Kofleriaceae bacterium]|nr:transglycosylase domain-containing protein [Kofleriaceae bacterium]
MIFPGLSRRWLIAGAVSLGVVLGAAIALFVVYPRVGAWMIRSKVGDKLAARLGREVRFGPIDVGLGHAVLHDVQIRGPLDGDTPLVHIDRIDVDFDTWRSLVGAIEVGATKLDGVLITIHRAADGRDNVQDVIDRLRAPPASGRATGGGLGLKPRSITVTHGKLLANDELTGATALVADADARWTPDGLVAHARGVSATTLSSPKASAQTIEVDKVAGATPIVSIEGGEVALWTGLALTGIGGKVVANPARAGEYIIDLAGGYGGVPGRLWTAKGGLDPSALTATLDLEAEKFQLQRLAPILEHSAVVDYAETSVDTKLHLAGDRAGAKFSGSLHLSGLNVGHPLIAEKEVHDLDLSAQIAGSFDRAARKLEITQGDFVVRNLPFSITGVVAAAPKTALASVAPGASAPAVPVTPVAVQAPSGRPVIDKAGDKPPAESRIGPHGIELLKLRLVIPPIDCQRALNAIPKEMAPAMAGYKVRGTFDTDVHVDIDWNDLDATQLDGRIGIKHCKVLDEPDDSPKRLEEEFEHSVEVEEGEWVSFDVGPSNDEFVPLDQISPYLIKSIMSTEDSAFYQHHGFITSEFRTALVNNLKAGRFVQGASSITMQMVKNVLLYRDKTLARKLQELFLTWHVENTLTKDRILEIYLNVIEYGPGLYGIGPAAYHFFGKKPKDLTPVEAAFFSTILPSPKERYKQYCAGTLTKWTTGKIERILQIMLKRDRLTQSEYDTAIATPLAFSKDGMESEEDCMKRVKKAIKNARPTNPLAAKEKEKERDKDGKAARKDRSKPEHSDRKDHRDRRDGRHRREDKLPI